MTKPILPLLCAGLTAAAAPEVAFKEMNEKAYLNQQRAAANACNQPFDLQQAKLDFFRIDRNENGVLSAQEWKKRNEKGPLIDKKTFIKKMARNKKTMFYSKNPEKMFEFVDVDRDNAIAVWETSYYRKRLFENGKPFSF